MTSSCTIFIYTEESIISQENFWYSFRMKIETSSLWKLSILTLFDVWPSERNLQTFLISCFPCFCPCNYVQWSVFIAIFDVLMFFTYNLTTVTLYELFCSGWFNIMYIGFKIGIIIYIACDSVHGFRIPFLRLCVSRIQVRYISCQFLMGLYR